MFGFIWVSLGSTLSTTYGVQNVMCASTTVMYPWLMCRNTKSRKSETPVMMSGFSIGMLFMNVIACFALLLMLWMPIAAMEPMMVDTVAAIRAITMVFWKVQVPLSMPGVISGVMMVFMPTVSTFAISEFLTNNKIKLFGTIIQENINSSMWNYGAALSLVMLVIIGITSLLQDNKKDDVSGGIV